MSHVADGILHAYLDGALDALSDAGELPDGATAADIVSHLNSCADCRSRLDAERAIREGAGIVLNDAGPPPVQAPPLSGMAHPIRDPAVAPLARRARWLPLSWAATVLLAVGAGWWGSEVWRADRMATAVVEQEEPRIPDSSPARAASPQQAPEAAAAANDDGADRDGERVAATGNAAEARSAGSLAAETLPPERLRNEPLPNEPLPAAPLLAEPQVAAVPAVRQPTGAAVGDVAGAARDSNGVAASLPTVLARNEVARLSQYAPVQPPAVGAVRSLQSRAVPESMARTEPLTMDAAALKHFVPGFSALAVFDSIAVDKEADRGRFATASASDLRRISGQVFIVAGASEPSIAVAYERRQTIVRVQQTLQSGEVIELISLQQHATDMNLSQQAVALEAVVVTGERPAREAAAQRRGRAAEPQSDSAGYGVPADLVSLPGVRTLADGRHQIVLRDSSGSLWVAMRAELSAVELHALVSRVRRPPPR